MNEIRIIRMGNVSVDSGQLLITDPCYLEKWSINLYADETAFFASLYHDQDTGLNWADSKCSEAEKLFDHYMQPLPEYDGLTPNQLIEQGRWVKQVNIDQHEHLGQYSYLGACHATLGDEPGGELDTDGSNGVAFATGGDGCYPVYAKQRKVGDQWVTYQVVVKLRNSPNWDDELVDDSESEETNH